MSHLKVKLLEYVGDGEVETVKNMQEAEIGQRIHSAVQMVSTYYKLLSGTEIQNLFVSLTRKSHLND